ncbi:lytic murein transglycosylase B [Ideonella sp. 4Y11]|uniref:Lytic murein transglycosylase B n=1 Tax=Ideonella aquatica TaxID=2824119 RepID=A0A940YJR0_9BURK|nr:lytic murein transglycosylase B [Ideonella aquatica]MBQ0960789.1 lytic murein transglycosylase B [Ideonella aquatica]
MSWFPLLSAAALLFSLAAAAAPHRQRGAKSPEPVAAPSYASREDAQALARTIAAAQGLDPDWVQRALAQARFQASVTRLVMPPPAGIAKNWAAYRARMVDAARAAEGLRFWQAHERWLNQAESRWGVPPEMVVAIVGVETYYGRIRGGFRVLDALATLSLDFPSGRSDRSGFYRDELAAFLSWCHAEQRDPTSVKGSYAGAIGLPQFMPSSIRRYAIDGDGDGHIDLEYNPADVISSVARYFAEFGWERGLPTHYGVQVPADTSARATLLAPDIQPSFSAQRMSELGAVLDEAGRAHAGPLALVELQNGDAAPSYVAGTRNFWVVTRYNWSSYYAMAVIDLAREIKRLRPPPPPSSASTPLQ